MLTIRSIGTAALSAMLLCATTAAAAEQQVGTAATPGWDLALTGGFVASGLTDPVWALGSVPGQPTRVVVRSTDRENDVNLAVAMFAQVYHTSYAWAAPLSVGVGIREDARATLYFGSGLRFGSHASFTAGVAVGSIAALPAGVVEGRPVTDTNVLSNLVTHTAASWFAGVTYTFTSLR